MSIKQRKLIYPAVLITIAVTALAFISVRARTSDSVLATPAKVPPVIQPTPSRSEKKPKVEFLSRLARQPEAFRLASKLGKRFTGEQRTNSVIVGTLTSGSGEERIRLVRRQDESGEQVEIAVGNGPASLTWTAASGALSSDEPAAGGTRALIERLVFDSPDHFVFAQFNGASYRLIGRNVRPVEAGGADDYSGPTWHVVSVQEPAANGANEAGDGWRLYHINTRTGLLDRIVSREDGGAVVAEFSDWVNQQGEMVPSRVTWSRRGQVIMQLSLTNFSQATNSR